MNDYYVYGHYILGNEKPFYIGKGKEQRAWVTQHRNFLWKEIVAEHEYEVRIIQNNMNEMDALLLETKLIESYGRIDLNTGILVNMTEGGNGGMGVLMTEEYRQKLSNSARVRWQSDRYREKQSVAQSTSWKNNEIRNKRIARMNAPDVKVKNSQSKKEMWKNPEYRNKSLKTRYKKWEDPTYKEFMLNKMREGHFKKGFKPCSDELKKKISIILKNKPKVICPYCNKTGNAGSMKRWHFDNCRLKSLDKPEQF